MQKKGNSSNIIVFKPDKRDKPSSHVVDLLSPSEQAEDAKPEKKSRLVVTLAAFRSKFNKEKPQAAEKEEIEEVEEIPETVARREFNFKTQIDTIKETALFRIFRAVFLFLKISFSRLYKLCLSIFSVFWFLPRFVYFSLQKFFSFLNNIFKKKTEVSALKSKHESSVSTRSFSEEDFDRAFSHISQNSSVESPGFEVEEPVSTPHSGAGYKKTKQNKLKIKTLLPRFKISYFKPALTTAALMLLMILPFKALTYFSVIMDYGGTVLGVSESAIGGLISAKNSASEKDFFEAAEKFRDAKNNFLNAQRDIDIISTQLSIISNIIPSSKLKMASEAENVLEAGVVSSEIGQEISLLFETYNKLQEKSIKESFELFRDSLPRIYEKSSRLVEVLDSIDSKSVPQEQREVFLVLRDKTSLINKSFLEIIDLMEKMELFLGFEKDKRYLLVFQNNSEIRASGGFMGSYAIVDFRNGEILNIEVPEGGTYDTEGAFYEQVVAPEPLHLLNPSWHFWDANWWPDWKKTAKKLEWFYERSGGSSVDGVIALTPTVIERILAVTGPLDMQGSHGVVITSDNFWEITQTFAEQKPLGHPAYEELPFAVASSTEDDIDPGTKPKKIIADLINVLKTDLPKRMTKEMLFGVLANLEESLNQKHVLFYFDDWELQKTVEDLSWAGRLKKTRWDYLMIINSNIGGAKSDRVIDQEIDHHSQVLDDGTILNTVKIKRSHRGIKGDKFTGQRNLSWMRVYVPLGSEFVEAKGFWPPDESLFEKPGKDWKHDPDLANSEENYIRDRISWTKIYKEDDKTVFANWVQVDPGSSVEVVIKYKLPFGLSLSGLDTNSRLPYALLFEKQAGLVTQRFRSVFEIGDYFTRSVYPHDFKDSYGGWRIEEELVSDKFWAITINK